MVVSMPNESATVSTARRIDFCFSISCQISPAVVLSCSTWPVGVKITADPSVWNTVYGPSRPI